MTRLKSYLLMIALALIAVPLAACSSLSMGAPPSSPGVVADATVLDEKAAIAVEASWAAAGTLVEAATDAGLVQGALAARLDRLDATAAKWVHAARAAYDAGNADGYLAALKEAQRAIAQITAAVQRVNPQPGTQELP